MRVMPSMLMNVAYGAMHPGEELSSAPSVPALEHMAFRAMTHMEFRELSDGQRRHAMMPYSTLHQQPWMTLQS